MPTLSAKDGFSCPSSTTLRGLQTRAIPAGQGRLRQILHRTKKIGLYFRGVNGPPLQTIIIIVKANYIVLGCQTPCQRRKYTKTPAGPVARVRPRRTIVRGGSRVTRGKRSVFPKRSQFTTTWIKKTKLNWLFLI